MKTPVATPDSPDVLFAVDRLLSSDELDVRRTVRKVVDERIKPHVASWYEHGDLPARELARELGDIGLLGMHLEGYGCAGMPATAYGLACLELEAGDSGIRSLVSVQGSLAMYAIHAYGTSSAASASPSPITAPTPPECARPPSVTAMTGC